MSDNRSDKLFASYLEASQRFDYFVVGAAVALVGYLGARFAAVRLGWNPATIELASLGSLLAAVVCGLKRIETYVEVMKLNQKRLLEEESVGSLTSAAASGAPALNHSTGEILGPGQLMYKAEYHKVGVEVLSEMLDKEAKWSGYWYRARDFFLVLGLLLLVLARVAQAYVE